MAGVYGGDWVSAKAVPFLACAIDDGADWYGDIEKPSKSGDAFQFRIFRQSGDFRGLIEASKARTNFNSNSINGYWRFSQKCSLLMCRQTSFNDMEILSLTADRKLSPISANVKQFCLVAGKVVKTESTTSPCA